ncbi:MAG: CPBP family glutamic-type intramembrane protease [Roseitalea porphyridii]|uniref:CPBP family glutamic-type intramembrane protease n=1 Tax=Roseitalea porphyridii TaxID=1852022 RepID=UPI0032EFBC6D
MMRVSDVGLTVLLFGLWLGASAALMAPWTLPSVDLGFYGQALGIAFILVLVAWLWVARRVVAYTPTVRPIAFPRLGFARTLIGILGAVLALFAIAFAAHPQLVLVAALSVAAAGLIVLRRSQVPGRWVGTGLGLGGACLLLSYLSERLDPFMAFYLTCIPVLFVGGTMLAAATGAAWVHSADGDWGKAAAGFLGGCALALPAALLNVSGGAHLGDAWVDRPWEPLVALVPGIAEETWARLFMLTLLYAVLRAASPDRAGRALFTAVLIAALVHALAHLPSAMVFSPAALQMGLAALLFGVPMGLIYARLGFEWAVGYHFFVDFVRFGIALLAP